MKEIDINIEGYNVNGICVGCLNYDRKMFYCDEIKECFKIVGNIDVPDGLNIQVCWECLAAVNKIIKFKNQILSSYDILIEYSRKQIFLNSPEDLTTHATTKLTTSPVDITDSTIVDIKQENGKNNAVCDEIIVDDRFDDELKTEEEKAFLEFDLDTIKPEPYEQTDTISDTFHDGDDSSNEDIQLSELRRRKVSKGRKRERGKIKNSVQKSQPVSRKLKNVPRDIVELYTMTEEEMWQVRAQDVASEHFEKLKYKCSDCIISFTSEKLRDYHVNGKHTPKTETSFACDVCKSYLLTKETLSVHRDKHLSAYKCKVCLKTSTIKAVMTQHACARNSEEHACVTCGKSFITKARLNYHKNICSQEKPQCDCCGKVFANKMTLKYHLKILPQNKEEKPKEKLYLPCKGCDKVFHSKKSYTAHVVIHSGVRYPCATCGKLFRWKRNLSRHARAHRERAAGAAHACAPCGKVFASRDCLHNHLRLSKAHVHPHALSHECSYCGKKFATKWCLVDHVDWDHLKKIKYQCSICFKAFKTAKIMVAHTNNIHGGRTKEDEGEHLCEICGKSYKTVKRLKGHVWAMHTQRSSTKSYKCKLCSATFTWQTSIYKHMKIMHDEGKRGKGRNVQNAVKKQEPFPDIELANRMQYFHQNLSSNLQSMSQAAHIQTLGAVPNAII